MLTKIKGPSSYEDLRKFEGKIYNTYYDACIARKLAFDSSEWYECMAEAARTKNPHNLRVLYSLILIHNLPTNPNDLWNKFKNDLSEDFVHKGDSKSIAYDKAYIKIADLLDKNAIYGRDFQHFVEKYDMKPTRMEQFEDTISFEESNH